MQIDNNIQKLDAGTEHTFQQLNQPSGKLNLDMLTENLCSFGGKLIIQSLFLRGTHNGSFIDNSSEEVVEAWILRLKKINPEYVMIYPIDRPTPEHKIEKISFEDLNRIAARVNEAGIRTKVFG